MGRRLGRKMERLILTQDQALDRGTLLPRVTLGARAPGISSIPSSETTEGRRTNLSFLGLNPFVKLVRFILEMSEHCLETTASVGQRREIFVFWTHP